MFEVSSKSMILRSGDVFLSEYWRPAFVSVLDKRVCFKLCMGMVQMHLKVQRKYFVGESRYRILYLLERMDVYWGTMCSFVATIKK